MPDTNHDEEQFLRDRAYFIWEREGRPEGRAHDHWTRAVGETSHVRRTPNEEPLLDEEKILDGRSDVNVPALLTKDVLGG